MTHNPLDHSYLLDINLTVHAELADKFYDALNLGGYKNKRLTQLQVLLANKILITKLILICTRQCL